MDHARPAQLIVVPAWAAGWQRARTAQAALGVDPVLAAVRAAAHVRAGHLDVALNRPDVRPSRSPAHRSGTVTTGTQYHYYRQTRYGR